MPFYEYFKKTLLQMAQSCTAEGWEITCLNGWRENGIGYSILLGGRESLECVFGDGEGENELVAKLKETLLSTEILNGQLVARYEIVAEENEKRRLRIGELERLKNDMFEELKLKNENLERLEKDMFEELKLKDVELGRVRSQLKWAAEQWEKKSSDLASKISSKKVTRMEGTVGELRSKIGDRRSRNFLEALHESEKSDVQMLLNKSFRGKEQLARLRKERHGAIEEKDIAEGLVKTKSEIIVRCKETEEKLLAEISELSKSNDELVEALQREQKSSAKRTADREKGTWRKIEAVPEEKTIFVFGGNESEREKVNVVQGTGKAFDQKAIFGELKEQIMIYEPIMGRV